MFSVCAIESIDHNFTYVGLTSNLEDRLRRHNKGYEKATKFYAPFKLIYSETAPSRLEARKREKYLNSGVGREFLRKYKTK